MPAACQVIYLDRESCKLSHTKWELPWPFDDEDPQAFSKDVVADLGYTAAEQDTKPCLPYSRANWWPTSHSWSAGGFRLASTMGFLPFLF